MKTASHQGPSGSASTAPSSSPGPCCVIAPQRGRNCEQGKNNKDSELIGHSLGGLQTNALGTSTEKLPGGVPAPAPQEGIMYVLRSCPLPLQGCCL